MSLRDNILASDDLPRESLYIPQWDETVYVRAMTGAERDTYEADLIASKDLQMRERLQNMRAKLVVLTAVDENGDRIFDDGDVEAVGKKSASALNLIVETAQELNALTDNDIEEIAGN